MQKEEDGIRKHSFTTMDAAMYKSGDYVMFHEAVRIAFDGINKDHYDHDFAAEIFLKAAVKYPFIVENCVTQFVLSHIIMRSDIPLVFDNEAILLCLYSAMDNATERMKAIDYSNARQISIEQNLIDAIHEKITLLKKKKRKV